MTSDRTAGNEAGHNWGNWNFHTGDGSLLVLKQAEDYFGWTTEFDGRHLPGTTVAYGDNESMLVVSWAWDGWGAHRWPEEFLTVQRGFPGSSRIGGRSRAKGVLLSLR